MQTITRPRMCVDMHCLDRSKRALKKILILGHCIRPPNGSKSRELFSFVCKRTGSTNRDKGRNSPLTMQAPPLRKRSRRLRRRLQQAASPQAPPRQRITRLVGGKTAAGRIESAK